MSLQQIEKKIEVLKAAELLAERQLSAIINQHNFQLTMVSGISTPDVSIHNLVDRNVWEVLICRAKEAVAKARKDIADFEAKFKHE